MKENAVVTSVDKWLELEIVSLNRVSRRDTLKLKFVYVYICVHGAWCSYRRDPQRG